MKQKRIRLKSRIIKIEGKKATSYYAKHSSEGRVFKTLEEAEAWLHEQDKYSKVNNHSYPYDLINALFNDAKIDIAYLEEHFDENLNIAAETITLREFDIITKRFKDGYTLEAVALQYGVTKERIRQIEAKALRKLKQPARLAIIRYGQDIVKLQDNIEVLKEQLLKEQLRLNEELRNVVIDEEILSRLQTINKDTVLAERKLNLDLDATQLSVRSYNCLRRAGIHTVSSLQNMTEVDLRRIRNLGAVSIREIKKYLNGLNLSLKNEIEDLHDDDDEEKVKND